VPKLPFRARQLIVSTIGALLLLPLDLFFGGVFAFSFGARESLWGWIFGLTAFWFQIFGIFLSFFKPRPAAVWMLANIGASCLIRVGAEIHGVYGPFAAGVHSSPWLPYAPSVIKLVGVFWAAPLLLALLLLRGAPRKERLLAAAAGHQN
jgi:hypothetical protein